MRRPRAEVSPPVERPHTAADVARPEAPSDELGIARAYMELMAQAMAQPQPLVQAQVSLMRDYMALWQVR